MPRLPLLALVVVIAATCPTSAWATSVLVPDQSPTVQAAFDAGADTIRVRPGRYFERPHFTHMVVLMADDLDQPRPRLDGLVIENQEHVHVRVQGMAFEGSVDLDTFHRPRGNNLVFEHCTLDSGLYHRRAGDTADIDLLSVRHSRIRGSISADAMGPVCESDTIEAGGVVFGSDGMPVVRDCLFTGPGQRAIFMAVNDFRGEAARNRIVGPYAAGIWVSNASNASIRDNHVSGCTEGIVVFGGDETSLTGNDVQDCGAGIRWQIGTLSTLADNRVLGSTGDGIHLEGLPGELEIQRNVVGRNGGHGMRLDLGGYEPTASLRSNTAYDNGGSGFVVSSPALAFGPLMLVVRQNIGYGNGAYGYLGDPDVPMDLECNDWFGNASGPVEGGLPSGDFALDPMFCDVANDSVGLRQDSPLANLAGCGLIGARGVACPATASVTPGPARFELAVSPNPASGALRLQWALPHAAEVDLRLYDIAGREVSVLARGRHEAGTHALSWDFARSPRRLGAGVYFLRLRSGAHTANRRIVVAR